MFMLMSRAAGMCAFVMMIVFTAWAADMVWLNGLLEMWVMCNMLMLRCRMIVAALVELR